MQCDDIDGQTDVSWSGVSQTDRMLFSMLTNPNTVDMERIPQQMPGLREDDLTRIEELDESGAVFSGERGAWAGASSPQPPSPRRPNVSTFSRPPTPPRAPTPPRDPTPPRPPTPPWPPTPRAPPPVSPEDDELNRRTLLLDLQQLEQSGVKLSKQWTVDDRAEDMMLELRRHTLAAEEKKNVTMMRDGLRILVTGIEMANNRMGLLDLEGWSQETCKDLNKHNASLTRIYRKYWRRGVSTSPEWDITLAIFGSMGMHHLRRSMSKQLVQRGTPRAPQAPPRGGGYTLHDDTDSEESADERAPP